MFVRLDDLPAMPAFDASGPIYGTKEFPVAGGGTRAMLFRAGGARLAERLRKLRKPPPSFAWQNQERSAPSRATTRPALITSLRRGRVATASGTDAASTTTKSAGPPTAMP